MRQNHHHDQLKNKPFLKIYELKFLNILKHLCFVYSHMICKIKFISSLKYWKNFNQKEKITLQNILRHRTFQLLFFVDVKEIFKADS